MLETKITKIGQGPAKLANDADIERDETGFTSPNLHRRIFTSPDKTENVEYKVGIHGFDSYRTTEYILHDEESTTSEIP